MFTIRRTVEQDEYIWEDSDPSEASEPPEDFTPNYWPTPESPVRPAPAPPTTNSPTPAQAHPAPPEPRSDPPAESQAKQPDQRPGTTRRCWKSHPGMPPDPSLHDDNSPDEPPAHCADDSEPDTDIEGEPHAEAKGRVRATPPDTHPASPSPPTSEHSLTRSQLDAHYDQAYEAACREAWLYDPNYDPLYDMIPEDLRGFPGIEETNYTWDEYDRAVSDHEDQDALYYNGDLEQAELEAEQLSYYRYRLRGGQLRFRPSDLGTEAIYQTYNVPLSPDAPDGSYHQDHGNLSPTYKRLLSWQYREHTYPLYESLRPRPTDIEQLAFAWRQRWWRTHDQTPNPSPPPVHPDAAPPTPPRPAPGPNDPYHGKRTTPTSEATESAATRRGNDATPPPTPSEPPHCNRATQTTPVQTHNASSQLPHIPYQRTDMTPSTGLFNLNLNSTSTDDSPLHGPFFCDCPGGVHHCLKRRRS